MSREETKERHSIMMRPSAWKILNELKRLHNTSNSELLEEALWFFLKAKKYNPLYFKLMTTVAPCEPEENEELTKLLDDMTEDDWKIASEYELPR